MFSKFGEELNAIVEIDFDSSCILWTGSFANQLLIINYEQLKKENDSTCNHNCKFSV